MRRDDTGARLGARPRATRGVSPWALLRAGGASAAAVLVLAACEQYLTAPGVDEEPAPPVLVGASLSPDSVDIVETSATVAATVRGRSDAGLDSVRIVVVSPSGTDRLRCLATVPSDGTEFEGSWQCTLVVPPGVESGSWTADSVGLFATADSAGSRIWGGGELVAAGVAPSLTVVGTPPYPAALAVEPELVVLTSANETATLVATVRSQYGGAMEGIPVTWTSTDAGVATVDGGGVVSPVGVGSAEIVAQADTFEARATVLVPATPTTLTVTPELITFDEVGASQALSVVVLNQFGDTIPDAAVTYASANSEVAGVDSEGTVRANGSGSTVITVRSGAVERAVSVTVSGGGQLSPGHRWINPAGGSFSDAGNWSRGAVPSAGDTAVVDLDGEYAVTMNAPATVAVLRVGSAGARPRLRVEDAILTVEDTAHFGPGARLDIVFGTLAGAGTVVVEDSLVWSGGLQTGSGRTVVTSTGTLLMDGEDKIADVRELVLEGRGTWTAGKVSLGNNGTLSVRAGAVLRLEAADTIAWLPGPNTRGYLRVDGRLAVAAGAGVTTVTAGFVNEGEIHIEPGSTLHTGGSGGTSGDGAWLIDGGAVMEVGGNSATVFFGPGGSVRGAGTLRVLSSVTAVSGDFDMDGRVEVVGNTFGLQFAQDTARVNELYMLGGPVSVASGTLQVREELVWESRGLGGDGTLHVASGAIARLATPATNRVVDSNAVLRVDGRLEWSAGNFGLRNGGDLIVGPGGVFEIRGGNLSITSANTLSPDWNPTILNEGEILKSFGIGTSLIQPTFTNRGVLTIGAGVVTPTREFFHEVGGVVRGAGVLDVSLATATRFAGVLAPGQYPAVASGAPTAGTLSIRNDLAIESTGRIEIEIGGTAGGTYDLLFVQNRLDAGGELRLSGFGGYVPAVADTLVVLRFAERLGAFAQVTGLDFGVALGGVPLDTVWLADRLMLVGRSGAIGAAPTVTIDTPEEGSLHPEGTPTTFTASATDPEDGNLSGSVTWTSNVDGSLGTGATIAVALSPGFHTVTASVTDSGGQSASASITVIVTTTTTGALFGVDSGNDALYRINPETGTSVRIGTRLGDFNTPVAMAIVPDTEEVLVWSNSPSSQLITVDVCSGVGTALQTFSASAAGVVGAIAYRGDGFLYMFNDGGLVRIDMLTIGRPLTTVTASLDVRVAGADFTPTNRLFGFELILGAPIRLVEIDPSNGAVLRSMDIRDESGTVIDVGVAGSLVWNAATGKFLASSIRGYVGVGKALFDLSLDGVASNPRALTGGGDQGMGFRSEPVCGG